MKVTEILSEGVAGPKKCWPGYKKTGTQPGTGKNKGKRVNDCEKIEEQGVAEGAPIVVMPRADRLKKAEPTKVRYQGDIVPPTKPPSTEKRGVKGRPGQRPMTKYDESTVAEDWNKVNKKDKTDGLSQKAVNAYRRENPGSKLKTAVTKKPSELKAGSKDAKRRKSFCARMSGNKGPMKDEKGRPTPKAKALSRWNCESVEAMVDLIIENMDHSKDNRAVPELKAALLARKVTLQKATDDQVYDIIDKIMTRIAKSHGISGQKLHDMWVDQYDQVPDTWIMK